MIGLTCRIIEGCLHTAKALGALGKVDKKSSCNIRYNCLIIIVDPVGHDPTTP